MKNAKRALEKELARVVSKWSIDIESIKPGSQNPRTLLKQQKINWFSVMDLDSDAYLVRVCFSLTPEQKNELDKFNDDITNYLDNAGKNFDLSIEVVYGPKIYNNPITGHKMYHYEFILTEKKFENLVSSQRFMIKPWNSFFEAANNNELTREMVSFFFELAFYVRFAENIDIDYRGSGSLGHSSFSFTIDFIGSIGWWDMSKDWFSDMVFDIELLSPEWNERISHYYNLMSEKSELRLEFLKQYKKLKDVWGEKPTFDQIREVTTNLEDEDWTCEMSINHEDFLLVKLTREQIKFDNYIVFLGKINRIAQKFKSGYVLSTEYHTDFAVEACIAFK